jgi:DNA-binding response OmpR family regulator
MPKEKTILLIDDDHDVLRGTSARLRRAGFETVAVDNSVSGVLKAKEDKPDAILLDARMPLLDGFEALKELRHQDETHKIPVVMLSACPSLQREALDAGARFFLAKPYDGEHLIAAVNAAIEETATNEGGTAHAHA